MPQSAPMASAPDTVSLDSSQSNAPGSAPAANASTGEPGTASGKSRLPPSVAGAFAAAAYALQHSTQGEGAEAGGTPAENAGPPYDQETGLLPQLYASRLGPRSRAYYLRQFARFDALDKGLPSWNAAAGFFTVAWCCLRGLWTEAGRYLVCAGMAAIVWWWGIKPFMPAAMAYGVAVALWLAAVAVPGLMGNAWVWRQVRAQTLRAITSSATVAQAHEKLATQATTPRHQILAGLVAALPLAAAAGAGVAWFTAQESMTPAETVQALKTVPSVPAAPEPSPASLPAPTPASTEPALAPAEPAEPTKPQAEATSEAAPEQPPAPAPEPQTAPPKVQASSPKPKKPSPEPAPAKAAPAASATGMKPGQFYLNVGVFSDQANAQRTATLLQGAGLAPMTQTLHSNKGEVTRIRTGPFATAKQAEKAAHKLREHKLETTVFQFANSDAHEKRATSANKP